MTNYDNGVYGHKDNCVEPENPKFRVGTSSDSKVTAENLVALAVWVSIHSKKKVREKSRECHNQKPQPFPDPKRKRKPTNPNKHKPNKRTKSTKISSLFPKRGNRNTKRTEKHNNKMTHVKTYNKSPSRITTK